MRPASALLLPALAVVQVGCVARTQRADLTSPVPPPPAWTAPSDTGAPPVPDRWWQAFGSPGLDELIDQALTTSLDLREARARLAQAATAARLAGSSRWPQITAGANASRSKNPAPKGVPSAFAGGLDDPTDSFGLNVGAAYELDVWGRNEAATQAADLDAAAAQEAVSAAAEAIAERLSDIWFALAEAQRREQVLAEQAELGGTYLQLVRSRAQAGVGDLLAIKQQEQQLLRIQAQIPLVRSEIDTLRLQLALLSGRTPGDAASLPRPAAGELPDPPPTPAIGVPSALVARRADLRAARRRLEAQDRRIAAAFADRFPSIRLSANIGWRAQSLSELVDNFLWSLAADVAAPLFDGGRRAAEVDRNKARLDELLAGYGKTLLQALFEVEGALRREAGLVAHVQATQRLLATAAEVLELARRRYRDAGGDYLPVLDAQRHRQDAELALVTARRRLLAERIRLYAALGGGWSEEIASK